MLYCGFKSFNIFFCLLPLAFKTNDVETTEGRCWEEHCSKRGNHHRGLFFSSCYVHMFVSLWFKGMWVLYIELGLYVLWQTPPFLCQLWLLRSSSTWPSFYLSQKSKRNKAGWKSWQVAKAVAQNRIVVRERDGLTLDWPSFYLPMFQKWGVTCVVCHWNIATYNIAKTSCIKNY